MLGLESESHTGLRVSLKLKQQQRSSVHRYSRREQLHSLHFTRCLLPDTMSVGEFTASNIAMDMDEKEKGKAGAVDMTKLNADISAQKEIAAKASIEH